MKWPYPKSDQHGGHLCEKHVLGGREGGKGHAKMRCLSAQGVLLGGTFPALGFNLPSAMNLLGSLKPAALSLNISLRQLY